MPPGNDPKDDWSFLRPPLVAGDLASLGGYRILSLIGQGAMGFVFKAEDTGLKRLVALKVMRPAIAATPLARDRLLREARAAAGIQSECVVTIHQVGEDRGIPFIAMEFLDGMTLDDWITKHKKTATVGAICRVGRDLLRGLAAAHEKGLIHRDIKPANLWVDQKSGRVKVLDFGLTRDTGSEQKLTMDGAIMGTPAYMAPEQANGKEVDCRADLFSAGTVLYHLATDSSPFHRDSLLPTLSAVCNHRPQPVLSIRPELPAELGAFIERLMSKDPGERPADGQAALALWLEVEKSVRNAQGPAPAQAAAGSGIRLPSPVAAESGVLRFPESKILEGGSARKNRKRKSPSSNPWPWMAGGIALMVLILVGLGMFLLRKKPSSESDKQDNSTAVAQSPRNSESKAIPPTTPTGVGTSPPSTNTNPPPAPSLRPSGNRAPDRFTNTVGMDLVLVKTGRFRLGGTGGDKFRKPVEIQSEYYIGNREVTQDQWSKITGEQPSHFSRKGEGATMVAGLPDATLARLPVENVSWKEAMAYIARLNAQEPNPGWEYRLPTEIEWEFACRGGHLMGQDEDLLDYYGFTPSKEITREAANLGDPTGRPKPTGSFGPNRLGLFDMHGNVAEWCSDTHIPKDRPVGVSDHVIKGGSWGSPPEHGRAGATFTTNENGKTWALGFRVVLGRKVD
jgi:serine/threonine protein kinase